MTTPKEFTNKPIRRNIKVLNGKDTQRPMSPGVLYKKTLSSSQFHFVVEKTSSVYVNESTDVERQKGT